MGPVAQQVGHVFGFGLTVRVGGEEAVINQPELVGFGVDVHAIDQADASVVVLVEHRIVEQDVAPRAEHNLRAHLLLELAWREMAGLKKVAYVVVGEPVQVVGQVRARVIHLAAHQKLPVKLCRHFHSFFLKLHLLRKS